MSEVPVKRTPWTTRELLAAYAEAWRTIVGGEPSRACLALLWAQASLECGRDGKSAYGNNPGNIMAFASWAGDYHVLRGAPECGVPGKLPAGATQIDPAATSIKCGPGLVPYLPAGGSRFRAYPTLLSGCTDKIRVVDRQWPRAIVALSTAIGPDAATAFVEGLKGYFTASPTAYASTLRSLAAECLRTTREDDWPAPGLSPQPTEGNGPVTAPHTPTSKSSQRLAAVDAPIVEHPRDGRVIPLFSHVEGEKAYDPGEPDPAA